MTKEKLYHELNDVNHSREKRILFSNIIINEPKMLSSLLEIVFEVDDKISCRAAWVLEFVCGAKLEVLTPYLEFFTSQLKKVHLDSAVRPLAKICEYIAVDCYNNKLSILKLPLINIYKEHIIEACFDWLINDEKIAVKAYAMHTLFLFGKEFEWIHPELKIILEKDYESQSSGYKARARKIMGWMDRNEQ